MSDMPQTTPATPVVKEGEILIKKQEDGNWKGYMSRNGNPLEVREVNPYDALMKLLTHP